MKTVGEFLKESGLSSEASRANYTTPYYSEIEVYSLLKAYAKEALEEAQRNAVNEVQKYNGYYAMMASKEIDKVISDLK